MKNNNTGNRNNFLRLAAVFEGGVGLAAIIIGLIVGVSPFRHLQITGSAIAWGVFGTVPMLVLFLVTYKLPLTKFRDIKQFLLDALGPFLKQCTWYDLALLAILAGVCEELLFRGVLQPWLETYWGMTFGLLVTSVLFGLAHMITLLYFILATVAGLYLGIALDIGEQRNLLTPILIHGIYDFVVFLILRHVLLTQHGEIP